MKPAITVMPVPSITLPPFGAAGAAPSVTEAILPLMMTMAPFSIVLPGPTMIRALEMTRFCAAAPLASTRLAARDRDRAAIVRFIVSVSDMGLRGIRLGGCQAVRAVQLVWCHYAKSVEEAPHSSARTPCLAPPGRPRQ